MKYSLTYLLGLVGAVMLTGCAELNNAGPASSPAAGQPTVIAPANEAVDDLKAKQPSPRPARSAAGQDQKPGQGQSNAAGSGGRGSAPAKPPAGATDGTADVAARPLGMIAPGIPIPRQLIGMTETDLVLLFGPPIQVRDRPPAKIHRYQGRTCVLEVTLFLDMGRNRFQVLEESHEGSDSTAEGRSKCITELANERAR